MIQQKSAGLLCSCVRYEQKIEQYLSAERPGTDQIKEVFLLRIRATMNYTFRQET